jgi:hypothetical protein
VMFTDVIAARRRAARYRRNNPAARKILGRCLG